MSAGAKRVVFSVRWGDCGYWRVYRDKLHWETFSLKRMAVLSAARFCRDMLLSEGTPSELKIFNKNHKLGKGSSSRRTYGKDSRKTRG